MANCKSNCGCSACSSGNSSTSQNSTSGYTPVGALGSLCRGCGNACNGCSSGCNNSNGCGNHCAHGCNHGCNNSGCSGHCGNGCGCNHGCNNSCGSPDGEMTSSCYPFYTGPCPPAPCNGCGCKPVPPGCGSAQCCGSCAACTGEYDSAYRCGCHSACSSDIIPGRCRNGDCGQSCGSHHCGCSDCGYDRCGSTASGRCEHYRYSEPCDRNHCITPAEENACTGMFAVSGPFNIASGCTVGLKARSAEARWFTVRDGCITIRKAGTYHLAVIVNIPAGETVDTVLSLELDGSLIPPELNIETCAGSDYAGHTVFHAEAGSVLKLNTQNTLSCTAAANPVITMIVTRITAGLSPA